MQPQSCRSCMYHWLVNGWHNQQEPEITATTIVDDRRLYGVGTETFRILEEAMAEEDVAALVVTPSLLMFIRLCVKVIANLAAKAWRTLHVWEPRHSESLRKRSNTQKMMKKWNE